MLVSVAANDKGDKDNPDDDGDITYAGFSVTGIRASDLRAAGGVVARARKTAFAATSGFRRVYPVTDDQEIFTLTVEMTSELSPDEIAHDGVVLADIVAADASGNQRSVSEIAFTGEDVVEKASDLQVQPSEITFTNILETAALIPSVQFEFRGRTPLPGLGKGITYESSAPDCVSVTPGGVVYPRTEDCDAVITVTYQGLDPVLSMQD